MTKYILTTTDNTGLQWKWHNAYKATIGYMAFKFPQPIIDVNLLTTTNHVINYNLHAYAPHIMGIRVIKKPLLYCHNKVVEFKGESIENVVTVLEATPIYNNDGSLQNISRNYDGCGIKTAIVGIYNTTQSLP